MMDRREFIRLGVGSAVCSIIPTGWSGIADYHEAQIARVTRRVKALERTSDAGFFFITDIHVSDNCGKSGELLAELHRRTGIRRTICGGDIGVACAWGSPTSEAAVEHAISAFRTKWINPIEDAGGDIYTAKGNHDFSTGLKIGATEGCTLTCGETRDVLMGSRGCRSAVTNPDDADSCYYYFDDASSRFRYIIADTTDSVRGEPPRRSIVYGMHDAQLQWIAEKALGTVQPGWSVVVVHHVPITGVVGDDGEERFYAPFRNLLEAYQNRGRVTVAGREWDFREAKGRIVMDVTGHKHAERQTWRNGILYVTEPCDAAYSDYISRSAPWCENLPEKKRGTPFEQTFDVVQFDLKGGLVHFSRIGGGQDRTIHLDAMRIRVGGRASLRPVCLKSVAKWACYDGDRVTFGPHPTNRWNKVVEYKSNFATIGRDGVLSAQNPGVTIVLAFDSDGHREVFPVSISM